MARNETRFHESTLVLSEKLHFSRAARKQGISQTNANSPAHRLYSALAAVMPSHPQRSMTKLTSVSLVRARRTDEVSHGNGGTGKEGMLVRGLGERRGFLRSASRR
jgi:hypothetical protein